MIFREPLVRALIASGAEPVAVELVVHTLFDTEIALQDGTVVRPTRGLRTGSPDAPALLSQLITSVVGELAEQWKVQGIGWGAHEVYSMYWWVDNCYLLARSMDEA